MITLILILVVVGFVLFLFEKFLPIDASIKLLIRYVVIFVLVMMVLLFLLDMFGIYRSPVKFR